MILRERHSKGGQDRARIGKLYNYILSKKYHNLQKKDKSVVYVESH